MHHALVTLYAVSTSEGSLAALAHAFNLDGELTLVNKQSKLCRHVLSRSALL